MENNTVIELSEAELDDVMGGVGRISICSQSFDGACAADCCSGGSN